MAIYVVMESGKTEADGLRRTAYIRDGFSFIAFIVPAFWLLWNRLWIEAILALAVAFTLGAFSASMGLGAAATTLLSLLVGLFVALEGPALRIAALRRRGWREWGVVRADDRAEADIRYLVETANESADLAEPRPAGQSGLRAQTRPNSPAMGLFDYPGGR